MTVQVHIKHGGKSRMLFNKYKLQGIAPKIQKLAKREGEVSVLTREGQSNPVVRHARPIAQLPAISDDEEVQLHAVPSDSPGRPLRRFLRY
jgi:hypothetical protein